MLHFRHLALVVTFLFALLGTTVAAQSAESVVIVGSFQTALGCDADFDATCDATALTFDPTHQLWIGTLTLPAGDYTYQAVVDGATVGVHATPDGDAIQLSFAEETDVTFWYAENTGWAADDVNNILASVPGSFNSEIGCPETPISDPGNPGDWAPDCLQTLLQDPDGDGIYEYMTDLLPAGNYEAKVAVNLSWNENYGDEGAPGGANLRFNIPKDNAPALFRWNAESKVMTIEVEGAPKGTLASPEAYWVARDLILSRIDDADAQFTLFYDPAGGLELTGDGLVGGEQFELTIDPAGVPDAVADKFPHLRRLTALRLPAEAVLRAPELLRGQTALGTKAADGSPIYATSLQIPGVLDDLYTYDGALGVTWDGDTPTLRVWAPTAQSVDLQLLGDDKDTVVETIPMTWDPETGVWSAAGAPDWRDRYYRYAVTVFVPAEGKIVVNEVTDPYAHSLSLNSEAAQIVDLNDTALQPEGWSDTAKPALDRFEDIVLYELHVRDFSILDESVPAEHRGTFMAFTHPDSNGMQHLSRIADAGVTHLHLLPVFDIATINEDPDAADPTDFEFLERQDPDSQQQQTAINRWRSRDKFNWGYDPFHYTVPEGSYSTDPDSTARIIEFRDMVQGVNEAGLRVVMDVVYNHTNAAGQSSKSVLDRVVPGYYHRLEKNGAIATSTCCQNTATEHNMMRKLMVDSIVTWAVQYKVDGFRFDLMGHHMVEDMQAVRDALDALTLEEHGVDGSKIYVYGEGWDFGEVQGGIRGENATQLRVGGMGIGTFNDRLRDAVRGGNPFGGHTEQGFATGLYTDPNGTQAGAMKARLALFSDQIRVGLAGNLADYTFTNMLGETVAGRDVDYNGAPAGYTTAPVEHIVYVSAHDNETLFDAIQMKAPDSADLGERVRMQNLALDTVMYAQGIPFFHAGSDILRSKSGDRDSYDSGDWFNAIDWTYNRNGWGIGLPVADKNEAQYDLLQPLLADESIRPETAHLMANHLHFLESAMIRKSTPLFRLDSADAIQNQLTFHNTGTDQVPGLIVMRITDDGDIDPALGQVVVVFNQSPEPVAYTVDALADDDLSLHPVQQQSADPRVRLAGFAAGTFSVPGRTVAVFVDGTPATSQAALDAHAALLTQLETDGIDVAAAYGTVDAPVAEEETSAAADEPREPDVLPSDDAPNVGRQTAIVGGIIAAILTVAGIGALWMHRRNTR